ncbi:ABC transporter ATP-binding protein [Gracilinema caldarium]|uniref:Phosphonate-transporting ATPase n=1 Tax=Gracilinema caldarium (strain ATCC 51460 / DSM 7334 / H1) TaxID=744872 RepID=F8EXW6_GRAC1|nr:ABC transporter ATP-binding protein [Gracilinema caldarium]AEJ20130.1 Phosphonate-transporting ATPase [Gracilinema caldarium DSM 7334]
MLQLSNITKAWNTGTRQVVGLRNINLDIERGEFVTIMGPSGSGKSTLLHIIGLLDSPSDGVYRIEGRDVMGLRDVELSRIRNRHFGFVFQKFHLLPELTAMENVMLPMGYAGVSLTQRKLRAQELLERMGLSHRLHARPTTLSGGEQQRVAIARSLANDPGFLLADEPTGNLPSDQGAEIMEILHQLNQEGMTIVMVTHDETLGAQGSRTVKLKDGGIEQIVEREPWTNLN